MIRTVYDVRSLDNFQCPISQGMSLHNIAPPTTRVLHNIVGFNIDNYNICVTIHYGASAIYIYIHGLGSPYPIVYITIVCIQYSVTLT